MIHSTEIERLQSGLFGSSRNGATVDNLKAEISRKFGEIRELNRKLDELSFCGDRIDSCKAADELIRDCPYMTLSVSTRTNDGSAASTENTFTVKVDNAPFFVFDRSGRAQLSTLPLNEIHLRMNSHSILGVSVKSLNWREALSDVFDSSWRPTSEYAGMVDSIYEYGHPHLSTRFSLNGSDVDTDASNMCMGNNDARHLLGSLNSPSRMMLLLKCLYSWLTEVNLGSMFSVQSTPVGFKTGFLLDELKPACVGTIQHEVLKFVRSQAYSRYVEAARQGDAETMSAFAGVQLDFLSGIDHVVPNFMTRSVEYFRQAYNGHVSRRPALSLGLHQTISALCMLARWDSVISRMQRVAQTILLVGGKVWEGACGDSCLLRSSGYMNRKAFAAYVADYEVARDGQYIY